MTPRNKERLWEALHLIIFHTWLIAIIKLAMWL